MAAGPRDAAFTHAGFQAQIAAAVQKGRLKEARELPRLASFNADANPQTSQTQQPALSAPSNLPKNTTTITRETKDHIPTTDTSGQNNKVDKNKVLNGDGSLTAAKKNCKKISKGGGVAQADVGGRGGSSIGRSSGDMTTSNVSQDGATSRRQVPTADEAIEALAHKLGPAAERFPHLPLGPGYRPTRYDYKGKGTWAVAKADEA